MNANENMLDTCLVLDAFGVHYDNLLDVIHLIYNSLYTTIIDFRALF